MRALNRVVALLLSAALFAAGLVIVIEVIRAAFDQGPVIVDWRALVPVLTRNTWRDLGPVLVAGGLVALGLVLLLLGLWRGKPALALVVDAPAVSAETSLISVEHVLRREALAVEGVTAARVRVSRRTARVAVATPADAIHGMEAYMRQRATATLDALHLVAPPTLKVRVHHVPAARAGTAGTAGTAAAAEATGTFETAPQQAGVGKTDSAGGADSADSADRANRANRAGGPAGAGGAGGPAGGTSA